MLNKLINDAINFGLGVTDASKEKVEALAAKIQKNLGVGKKESVTMVKDMMQRGNVIRQQFTEEILNAQSELFEKLEKFASSNKEAFKELAKKSAAKKPACKCSAKKPAAKKPAAAKKAPAKKPAAKKTAE